MVHQETNKICTSICKQRNFKTYKEKIEVEQEVDGYLIEVGDFLIEIFLLDQVSKMLQIIWTN